MDNGNNKRNEGKKVNHWQELYLYSKSKSNYLNIVNENKKSMQLCNVNENTIFKPQNITDIKASLTKAVFVLSG